MVKLKLFEDFSEFLLDIGEGIINKKGSDKIKIPSEYLVKTQDDLIDHVFPNLDDIKDLTDGAIYTPLNKDMTDINQICLKRSLGDKRSYLSADCRHDTGTRSRRSSSK